MHREDTSTSSEDEASTSGTVSTTTTTTADMCCTEVRNGEKVLRCTGCGYTSDRRANVTRHYERIHGELGKYKKCACGEVFQTKWEFYNHCDECHPTLRQSSYTTTQVYKLKETKARLKLKPDNKPYVRVESQPVRQGYATRSSTRKLRTLRKSSTSSTESAASSSSGSDTSLHKEISFSGHKSGTDDENQEVSSTSSSKSFVAGFSSGSDTSIHKEISFSGHESDTKDENQDVSSTFLVAASSSGSDSSEKEESFCIYQAEDTNAENIEASSAPLPIKKRYLQGTRRVLGDITNGNVKVLKVNDYYDNNNNAQVPIQELYLAAIDEKQRAFISHIDFDELDAILNLRNMKKPM